MGRVTRSASEVPRFAWAVGCAVADAGALISQNGDEDLGGSNSLQVRGSVLCSVATLWRSHRHLRSMDRRLVAEADRKRAVRVCKRVLATLKARVEARRHIVKIRPRVLLAVASLWPRRVLAHSFRQWQRVASTTRSMAYLDMCAVSFRLTMCLRHWELWAAERAYNRWQLRRAVR